jgi:hypothetical protein
LEERSGLVPWAEVAMLDRSVELLMHWTPNEAEELVVLTLLEVEELEGLRWSSRTLEEAFRHDSYLRIEAVA